MPVFPAHDSRYKDILFGVLFWAALTITGWLYSCGLGTGLQFDDEANLKGLANVQNLDTAISFVFSGIAGPLGRPLALLSFVPQAYAWPKSPELMIEWNIYLHLLNGALVTALALRLSALTSTTPAQQLRIAVPSGALWMLLPLLASSSLLIVQRMTTLSAFFIFCGLFCYLSRRLRAANRPERSLLSLSLIVTLFTVLATFSKENGLLFPLYVLSIEASLLSSDRFRSTHKTWKTWQAIFLFFPLIIISAYLISRIPYNEATTLQRNFTGLQRIASEGYILWVYLIRAFLPTPSALGPFHDLTWQLEPHQLSLGLTLFACAVATGILSVCYRKRYPLATFAVLWYLLGHLLESTTIPLELYFEHRNYVPLVGPIFALMAFLSSLRINKKIVTGFIFVYMSLLVLVTYMTTSLWGQPLLAAEIWAKDYPKSVRAALQLAKELEKDHDLKTALRVMDSYNQQYRNLGLQIVALKVACDLEPEGDHQARLNQLLTSASTARFESWAVDQPEQFHAWLLKHHCAGMNFHTVSFIADAVISNPRYASNPIAMHNLYAIKGLVALQYDDITSALSYFHTALTQHIGKDLLKLSLAIAKSHQNTEFFDKWSSAAK